jgi:hypothetical protein
MSEARYTVPNQGHIKYTLLGDFKQDKSLTILICTYHIVLCVEKRPGGGPG